MEFNLHKSLTVSVNSEPAHAYYEVENGEKTYLKKWKFAYFESLERAISKRNRKERSMFRPAGNCSVSTRTTIRIRVIRSRTVRRRF